LDEMKKKTRPFRGKNLATIEVHANKFIEELQDNFIDQYINCKDSEWVIIVEYWEE
jgi:hypothetical protein